VPDDRGQPQERARRIGLNEAVFREFNERLEEVGRGFDLRMLDLVCECGDAECTERIRMSVEEYEQLRTDPRQFAVVPSHEAPDIEDVVERKGDYDVVYKRAGGPAELARETDPRSP
jgi:hypothetical protein